MLKSKHTVGSANVDLRPMLSEASDRFLALRVRHKAEGRVASGNWQPQGVVNRARRKLEQYLWDGMDTPGHFFFDVVDSRYEKPAGTLWYLIRGDQTIWVNRVSVDAKHRRTGSGEWMMKWVERIAKREQVNAISLHVYGHNTGARALYEKIRYVEYHRNVKDGVVTNLLLMKKLLDIEIE
jgi:GNAT superfamily N-acetyltransferase